MLLVDSVVFFAGLLIIYFLLLCRDRDTFVCSTARAGCQWWCVVGPLVDSCEAFIAFFSNVLYNTSFSFYFVFLLHVGQVIIFCSSVRVVHTCPYQVDHKVGQIVCADDGAVASSPLGKMCQQGGKAGNPYFLVTPSIILQL